MTSSTPWDSLFKISSATIAQYQCCSVLLSQWYIATDDIINSGCDNSSQMDHNRRRVWLCKVIRLWMQLSQPPLKWNSCPPTFIFCYLFVPFLSGHSIKHIPTYYQHSILDPKLYKLWKSGIFPDTSNQTQELAWTGFDFLCVSINSHPSLHPPHSTQPLFFQCVASQQKLQSFYGPTISITFFSHKCNIKTLRWGKWGENFKKAKSQKVDPASKSAQTWKSEIVTNCW